jgi:putative endonuclease
MHPMHEYSYFTYIVASRSHTLYIGVTGDLQKRIFQHKWKEYGGFSAKYNCDRLVWFESYQNITAAIAREKQLKGWRREKKIALIEKMNPAWIDLSKDWYDIEPADFLRAADPMYLNAAAERKTTTGPSTPPLALRSAQGQGRRSG